MAQQTEFAGDKSVSAKEAGSQGGRRLYRGERVGVPVAVNATGGSRKRLSQFGRGTRSPAQPLAVDRRDDQNPSRCVVGILCSQPMSGWLLAEGRRSLALASTIDAACRRKRHQVANHSMRDPPADGVTSRLFSAKPDLEDPIWQEHWTRCPDSSLSIHRPLSVLGGFHCSRN